MPNICAALHDAVEKVVGKGAITGIRMPRVDDRSTWKVHFKETPTPAQEAAAASVLTTFDVEKDVPEDIDIHNVVRDLAHAVRDAGVKMPDSVQKFLKRIAS